MFSTRKKMWAKLIIPMGLMLTVVFSILIYNIEERAAEKTEALATKMAREMAFRYGNVARAELNAASQTARTLAVTLARRKELGIPVNRAGHFEILQANLKENENFLGIWSIWEKDAPDGLDAKFANTEMHDATGRLVPYYFRTENGIGGRPCEGYDTPAGYSFYGKAMESAKEVITDPTLYNIGGKKIFTTCIVVPIIANGKPIGVVGVDYATDYFWSFAKNIRPMDNTGYTFLVSDAGIMAAHPNEEFIGKNISETPYADDADALTDSNGQIKKRISPFDQKDHVVIFQPFEVPVGKSGQRWSMAVSIPETTIFKSTKELIQVSIVIGILALLVITAFFYLFLRKILTNPLVAVVDALQDVAEGEGDLTMRLPKNSQDELGQLAHWFNVFMSKLQGIITELAENSETMESSSGDLTGVSTQIFEGAEGAKGAMGSMTRIAGEMSQDMNSVAAAMEQASGNVGMVAAAAEEMSTTIQEIARNSENARCMVEDAVKQADSANTLMAELGRAATDIGKVTESITEIAEQTNLLALNATIEAARAGDAGKGFAVVANEIKDLAGQASSATQEIRQSIASVQNTSNAAVGEINTVSKAIHTMNDVVVTIATAVEEQATATDEISGNISHAAQGINEVNSGVARTANLAGDVSTGAGNMLNEVEEMVLRGQTVQSSASRLSELSAHLKRLVGSFKTQ